MMNNTSKLPVVIINNDDWIDTVFQGILIAIFIVLCVVMLFSVFCWFGYYLYKVCVWDFCPQDDAYEIPVPKWSHEGDALVFTLKKPVNSNS